MSTFISIESTEQATTQSTTISMPYNIIFAEATDIGGNRENQDASICLPLVLESGETAVALCVFDGHGREGMHISKHSVNFVESFLRQNIDRIKDDHVSLFNELFLLLHGVIDRTYRFGGTTATINIFLAGKLYSANVGDSTSKLFSKKENLSLELLSGKKLPSEEDVFTTMFDVSFDHEPTVKEEYDYVKEHKPDLEFYYDSRNTASNRNLYDKDGNRRDASKVPGTYYKNVRKHYATVITNGISTLAMTRSIGDKNLTRSDPTIIVYDLTSVITPDFDLCLVIASDGVWDNWLDNTVEEFIFDESCLKALDSEDGVQQVTNAFMQRNAVYGRKNFGSNTDNATSIVAYIRAIV